MQLYASYQANQKHQEEAKQLADEGDAEMQQLARQEMKRAGRQTIAAGRGIVVSAAAEGSIR